MFIHLDNVSVQFSGNPPVNALQHVDFSVDKGEWINILGPSGSGKTTLLNVIGGMLSIQSGTLKVADTVLSEFTNEQLQSYRRNSIGYIFQDYRLFDQFTVIENVILPQLPYEQRSTLEKKAKDILDQLKMSHRLRALPSELSGGEKQRTAIARALLNDPDILLCDEPTGNLDEENRENILHIIRELHKTGMTILLVTHDNAIAEWGDRRLYIRSGQIEKKVLS